MPHPAAPATPSPVHAGPGGETGLKGGPTSAGHPATTARTETAAPASPTATALHCTPPAWRYPAMARHMHEEGTATVDLVLAASGQVEQAAIKTSTGYDDLDSTALAAARRVQCTAEGGTMAGRHVLLPVMFHLH
ncbi:energy transducer TonB [Komagataeibacter melaceti]|uniref:energy transducer TonB n=1 Tax=Komagataeibacter melaceti TaxID=2766577 RepID=UPI001F4E3309|nr:energy transducer TonB [Komagataeibacter melaceti]